MSKELSELFNKFPTMLKIYNIEPTYNGKSDLLRYLILYAYGGIYVDADMVWINNKSFELSNNIPAAVVPSLIVKFVSKSKSSSLFGPTRKQEEYVLIASALIDPLESKDQSLKEFLISNLLEFE